jgi:hypothetical protein
MHSHIANIQPHTPQYTWKTIAQQSKEGTVRYPVPTLHCISLPLLYPCRYSNQCRFTIKIKIDGKMSADNLVWTEKKLCESISMLISFLNLFSVNRFLTVEDHQKLPLCTGIHLYLYL